MRTDRSSREDAWSIAYLSKDTVRWTDSWIKKPVYQNQQLFCLSHQGNILKWPYLRVLLPVWYPALSFFVKQTLKFSQFYSHVPMRSKPQLCGRRWPAGEIVSGTQVYIHISTTKLVSKLQNFLSTNAFFCWRVSNMAKFGNHS